MEERASPGADSSGAGTPAAEVEVQPPAVATAVAPGLRVCWAVPGHVPACFVASPEVAAADAAGLGSAAGSFAAPVVECSADCPAPAADDSAAPAYRSELLAVAPVAGRPAVRRNCSEADLASSAGSRTKRARDSAYCEFPAPELPDSRAAARPNTADPNSADLARSVVETDFPEQPGTGCRPAGPAEHALALQ